MGRQDTTFRECVPLKNRVAIALWKLPTSSEYRTVGHVFGVSRTTVCRCVQQFCAAAELMLVPEQIRLPDQKKSEEIAAYSESRQGSRSGLVLLMDHTYPSWHHRSTTVIIAIVKAGTPSSFKVL